MKQLKYILIFFFSLFLLVYSFFKYDGYLGEGEYFIYYSGYDSIKSKKNENIFLSDIRNVEYNDDFILALRIPIESYTCSNGDNFIIANKRLQYVLIDKNHNKIYLTYNKDNFYKMKKKLNVNLQISSSHEKRVLKRLKYSMYNNDNKDIRRINKCKKDFIFPVIEY